MTAEKLLRDEPTAVTDRRYRTRIAASVDPP
jgi:hypothetical protein